MLWLYISLGAVASAALLWLFVWFNNSCLKTVRYETGTVVGGRKIVHLSDLHGKKFGRDNKRLVSKIRKLNPDVIAITGDIIHKYRRRDLSVALQTVSALKDIAPVLFVAGNHEMRGEGYDAFKEELVNAGANVLDDGTQEFAGIKFTGINDLSLRKGRLTETVPENPGILLAHEPHFIKDYSKAGFGLVLSGHAHGGQWRIPFTRIGLYAPGQGVFPEYASGKFIFNETEMIVSGGLGNSKFPLRLFNRPEIVLIETK